MNTVSMTGSGLIVVIIEMLLQHFGITPDAGSVLGVVNSTLTVVGWLAVIVGQLRRADLSFGLIRKA